MKAGAGGGALFGGDPEESKSVTKKNSSPDPELFWNIKDNLKISHYLLI